MTDTLEGRVNNSILNILKRKALYDIPMGFSMGIGLYYFTTPRDEPISLSTIGKYTSLFFLTFIGGAGTRTIIRYKKELKARQYADVPKTQPREVPNRMYNLIQDMKEDIPMIMGLMGSSVAMVLYKYAQ